MKFSKNVNRITTGSATNKDDMVNRMFRHWPFQELKWFGFLKTRNYSLIKNKKNLKKNVNK